MKILTRVVVDMASGSVLEEESFDYDGPVALAKDSPSVPPAPDYAGAAKAQQQGSMVNQVTPYGSQIYSQVGAWPNGDPRYQSTINLDPSAQKTLDTQMQMSQNLGNLGVGALERTDAAYKQPFDQSSVGKVEDQAYGAQTARLDPQWAANDKVQASTLANQGIMQGSEAYDNAMRGYGQQKNDAYTQARLAAIQTAPQTFSMGSAIREQPLNELNAIRTGAQVQNPTFAPQGAGPNLLGAAGMQGQYNQGLYNSQVGQANSFNSGLFSLGAAALGAPVGTFSDRRLKSKIERIGTHPLGIGIYRYELFGEPDVGVMADEVLTVKPEAVSLHPSGFMQVDYGAL